MIDPNDLDALAGTLRRVYAAVSLDRAELMADVRQAEAARANARATLARHLLTFMLEHGILTFASQVSPDGAVEVLSLSGVVAENQEIAAKVMNAMAATMEEKEGACVH